jgi:hypothetical protein
VLLVVSALLTQMVHHHVSLSQQGKRYQTMTKMVKINGTEWVSVS